MYQARPTSRGRVRITSPDPRESPSFVFNHLTEDEDVRTLLAGMKLAGQVGAAMPSELEVRETDPGRDVVGDEELLEYVRDNADTAFHFCGSARMGSDDKAVVDPQLRVRGVDGLRVIDASVMPTIASGNIHPAVLMIAEKGADLVKGRTTASEGSALPSEAGAGDGHGTSRLRETLADVRLVAAMARKGDLGG
jgi:choline dehydrogenase